MPLTATLLNILSIARTPRLNNVLNPDLPNLPDATMSRYPWWPDKAGSLNSINLFQPPISHTWRSSLLLHLLGYAAGPTSGMPENRRTPQDTIVMTAGHTSEHRQAPKNVINIVVCSFSVAYSGVEQSTNN